MEKQQQKTEKTLVIVRNMSEEDFIFANRRLMKSRIKKLQMRLDKNLKKLRRDIEHLTGQHADK